MSKVNREYKEISGSLILLHERFCIWDFSFCTIFLCIYSLKIVHNHNQVIKSDYDFTQFNSKDKNIKSVHVLGTYISFIEASFPLRLRKYTDDSEYQELLRKHFSIYK